jgi:PAS domain S-box-containing protein
LVDVEAWGVPVIIDERRFGFIGLYNDISELKQTEEELRRQKEYFEAMFDNTPVAVVTLDENSKVVSWNQAAEKLYGYSQEEAVGQFLDNLVAKHPSIYDEAVRYTQQTQNNQRVHAITKRTRKDGTFVEVELMSVPVALSGKFVGNIALYYDIGELQEARRAAEAANKAKSDFLARMSHELRTPLNAIIGFTRLVKRKGEDALPEKQVENLDKVLISADHLLALINDILDISKIEAGAMEVKPTSFKIDSLVDLCITTTQPLVKSEDVKLNKKVEEGLPEVFSDENKVKQILLNLLGNAVKFTHKGSITLKANLKDGLVNLSVTDTGIGISRESLERIFEEFQQADTSTTREYGGTGLGLSISQRLAHLLGGEIVADSTEGKGSTFTLILPLRYTANEE